MMAESLVRRQQTITFSMTRASGRALIPGRRVVTKSRYCRQGCLLGRRLRRGGSEKKQAPKVRARRRRKIKATNPGFGPRDLRAHFPACTPCGIGPIRPIIAADMAKTPANPSLSLVSAGSTRSAPPRTLGPDGTALWNRVMAEYRIEDAGGIELLAQACAALDRAEALAAAIAEDGAVIRTPSGPKSHPACKDELACRAFVARTLERLGLNVEAIKPPGRPPTSKGWSPPS